MRMAFILVLLVVSAGCSQVVVRESSRLPDPSVDQRRERNENLEKALEMEHESLTQSVTDDCPIDTTGC